MIKVFMNEIELGVEFTELEQAKKYVATCKRVDKKYNEKNKYKIVGGK